MHKIVCEKCKNNFRFIGLTTFDNEISYGIARCQCSSYPIVEGVIVINSQSKKITELLYKKHFFESFCYCIGTPQLRHIPFLSVILNHMFFKRISVKKIVTLLPNQLIWSIVNHLTGSSSGYYFKNRASETDAYFVFMILSFCKKNKTCTWLNIGTGIHNFYHEIEQTNSHLNIIALDQSFSNCFFSTILSPSQRTKYICASVDNKIISYQKFDLISFFDTFQFIPNNVQILKRIIEKINFASTKLVLSGVINSQKFIKNAVIFPVKPIEILNQGLTQYTLIDDEKLAQLVKKKYNNIELKYVTSNKKISRLFKYTLIYPSLKRKYLKLQIPRKLLVQNTRYWSG